jgi:hypothetical protein
MNYWSHNLKKLIVSHTSILSALSFPPPHLICIIIQTFMSSDANLERVTHPVW